MVQEKNAAERAMQSHREHIQRTLQKIEDDTVRFAWVVIEHKPAYNTGGYYDQDIPAESVTVSPVFDTEEEAQAWMDRHEPDEGKTLHVKRKRLLRREWTEWVWY